MGKSRSTRRPPEVNDGPYEMTYSEHLADLFDQLPPMLRDLALWADRVDDVVFPDERRS